MSSNDKTRQKLLDSMRKTKAGSRKESAATKAEDKKKPAKAAKNKKTATVKKPEKDRVIKGHTDPYQSRGPHVWPD